MNKKNKGSRGSPAEISTSGWLNSQQDQISPLTYCLAITLGLLALYQFGPLRFGSRILSDAAVPYLTLFGDFSPDKLLNATLIFLKLMAIIVIVALGGRLLVRAAGFTTLSFPEELVLGLGAGLGCASLLMFGVGMLGCFTESFLFPLFSCIALGAGIASIPEVRRRLTNRPSLDFVASNLDPTTAISTALLAILACINLIASLAPPIFYDTLVYHLALPNLYILNAGMIPTPSNIYSGAPLNTEMLYTMALFIGGEKLATIVPWGLSIATILAIILCCKRFASSKVGILAALLFYSCPMVAAQVWFSLVEINWCFLGLLTIFATLIHLDEPEPSWKRCVMIGALAGFTAGTKYNAIAILPALVMMLLARRRLPPNSGLSNPLIESAVVIAIAVLTVFPWFARNWAWHGNPIFPFFSSTVDWRALMIDAQGRNISALVNHPRQVIDIFLCLWSPEWIGSGFNEIGLPFLFLSSFLIFIRPSTPNIQGLCIAALTGWFFWSTSSRMPRFFLATLPALAILIAIGATSNRHSERVRILLAGLLILFCGTNCLKITAYWYESSTLPIVFGNESASNYLNSGHPGYFTPYFAAADFANHQLPQQSKIIFFMESRGYYFKRNFLATSYFATNPLVSTANDSSSSQRLRDSLRADGYTHMFVNRAELFRRGGVVPFSAHGTEIFNTFTKQHLKLIFRNVVTSPPAHPKDRQWVEIHEIL